ncbi:hypothetical protein P168DRAFT_308386 [Aspergillus campestris IBT 28561]|uniref:Prolyl 4-hydroxylase alpha subunit domain-containing protein n=1 Tax=Aspergillus campestris (strain IBT 28561) TaxID=1392248 RepID=A0A2I1DEN4_ASPC2|nr:uncharacterized protein P168DRAFT_308386 [Aspergillus campestris IBT 28561]PKY08328.1 hypothetical protein P168DRAFT_308386 [Aspergillus campestris IBT 28561]
MITLNTILSSLFYLLPLYLFVFAPSSANTSHPTTPTQPPPPSPSTPSTTPLSFPRLPNWPTTPTAPVRCLTRRAASFQGWRPYLHIEPLWAQRYNVSGHYTHHYDWAGSAARGGDRATTFMVYLDDGCKGGGTNFPRLVRPVAREWCRFIECGEGEGEGMDGITFKPIAGNAVFWENLRPDGSGYPETWHAALPVTEGVKVGLNIWSWYQPPRRRG